MIRIFSLFSLLLFAFSLSAQKVYSTHSSNRADIKVFVVNKDYQADIIVYRTSKEYRAKASENKGIWFFCDKPSRADKKIYFVDKDYQADLKVFFTNKEYRAGWRNDSKKYPLF